MNGLRAFGFAALGLALHALLLSGGLAGSPPGVRLALAFLVLVLLPGHGWLAATGALPPGGAALSSGWALGFGVLALSVQVLATRLLHVPFTVLATWSALPAALAWVAAWRFGREPSRDDAPSLHGFAVLVIAAAALAAAVHVGRLGTPVSYYTDSPDHIGTIRRMLASGDAFPVDAFFRDAGAHGADPRKGLWHPCVALIAKLAGADPYDAWRLLSALLAPLFVLNAAAFAFLLGGSAAAAVGAWALLVTYGSSMGAPAFREAVFATKLADQLALATAAAVLSDLAWAGRGGDGARRSRLGAVGLALGTVCAHVFGAIQFGLVFGALGAGLLVVDRGFGPRARRLAVTALALGVACLPYLLWRARSSYAPSNIIHLEPQGLMLLPGSGFVISPGVLWDWMGQAWLLIPLSWWAWARSAKNPAVLYLLTTTVAVFALLFVPPVAGALQPKLGYLLMRFVWILPVSGAVAFAATRLAAGAARGAWRARFASLLGLAGVALLLRHAVLDAAYVLGHPGWIAEQEQATSVLRWGGELKWMDAHLPAGSVVLSDPATSYSVPMMTRHWVQTLVDQHSSPNDSLALDRILDARDALDPYASWERTREVVRRWGVTHVVLNGRFAEIPRLDYWAPDPAWFRAARGRLDAAPEAFPSVLDRGDFVVYAIRPHALDTLSMPPAPRPFVRAALPGEPEGRSVGAGLPRLASFRLRAREASPGDTVHAVIDWRAVGRAPAGAYLVSLRFDRAIPGGWTPPPVLAKPWRKLLERVNRERYRFRMDHIPVDGAYGVDLWRPGTVVRDTADVVVPGDVAAGEYVVQVSLRREPHYPNYRFEDYFVDRDYYSGIAVDSLRVRPRGGAR